MRNMQMESADQEKVGEEIMNLCIYLFILWC
jgi:hypothetical protein